MSHPLVRSCTGLLVAAGLIAATLGSARADIKLPNGTVVPLTANLSGYLNGSANNTDPNTGQPINEGINTVTDAAITPERFSPLCDFSGKYIAKGGGANFAIGW